MNIIKKLEDSIWAKVILAVVVVVIAFAARSMLENKHEESKIDKQTAGKTIRETSYAETVPEDDPILNVFKNAYPTAEVLLACREDVTDDGLDDPFFRIGGSHRFFGCHNGFYDEFNTE